MPQNTRLLPVLLAVATAVPSLARAQDAEPQKPPIRLPSLGKPNAPVLPHMASPVRQGAPPMQKRLPPNPIPPPANTNTANDAAANTDNASSRGSSSNPRANPRGAGGRNAPNPPTTAASKDAGDDVEKRVLPRDQMAKSGKFKLQFDKVDIEELVKQVADMTGKMFILPENIRGKITIIGPQHGEAYVSAEEVYAAFLSALDANNLAVYPVGKFLRIEEKRNARQSTIPTFLEDQDKIPESEMMVTKIFRVRYSELEPVRGALANLVTPNGQCDPFQPDLLICHDVGSNMHRLERVLEQLDQPGGVDSVHIVQVQYAAASDLADKLTKIFEQKKGQPGARVGALSVPKTPPGAPIHKEGGPLTPPPGGATNTAGGADEGTPSLRLVLADERTNKLIVICPDKSFDRVLTIIKDLDVPTAGEGGVHVYYLQNAAAEELANTLSNLTQGAGARGPGGAKPGGGKGPAMAELFSGEVKITAEKATNSLVIIASDTDYRNLVKVIEKLDLARREVFVEAVIMEVNLDDNTNFGARLHTGLPPIDTNLFNSQGQAVSLVGSNPGGTGLPPSFSLLNLASFGGFLAGLQGPAIPALQKFGINVPSFGVLIHALTTNNNANVLSTPHILTTDNEEAEITVGQNVPFQAGFSPSSLGSTLGSVAGAAGTSALGTAGLGSLSGLGGLGSFFAPIQRQNVELKLKIKPQINEGDTIRMVVDEQTEEIASQDPVLGPTTSKRSAKTTIVVKDQQTVVIGGLIQEHNIESVSKVPILGDIPIVGHLFREETRHKIRTNLLLFLTPYIIREQSDFQRIFERKLKERQEFVEEFYGHEKAYEAFIDYSHKSGPLSKMRTQLRAEANKVENGGSGVGSGERLIGPANRANSDLSNMPPSGRPAGGAGGAGPEGTPEGVPPSSFEVHTGAPAPIPAENPATPANPAPPPPPQSPQEQ
ncbi:MAG: type II secretion system secretin GspD [Deltaproteobacteria bacterium]|nr:type II secretion system secretin GspD [Deltaproteobacteria bacterium]